MIRLGLMAALLVALTGCAAPAPVAAERPAAPVVSAERPATPVVSAVVPAPAAVLIPRIGASSTLEPLGLDPATGKLAVAPISEPEQATWYEDGVIPGQLGPAVVAGHVNGRVGGVSVPGVFARLAELAPGDEVFIERFDAPRLRFEVYRVETHDKDEFPTAEVYRDVNAVELRLITCGGAFSAGSYEDNVIVWARLT